MSLYKTIFLVDDDPEDQEIFIEALQEIDQGIECLCANNGEAALKMLSGDFFQKPDIIFLDLNMPRLNGRQLLKALKSDETLKDIPVCMYSTFFGDNDIHAFSSLGARYLRKHTGYAALRDSLKDFLGKPFAG